ncbi:hypothetical protein JTB14_021142 [Gonioctena quinquepunctata]|nr:hypothetical protein JTB14_021142 [Gonioctena quinquepunctata]
MNLDKLDIPITSEKSQEMDKNSPDSPATPLYADARTSNNPKLPSPSEVEQTVDKGVTVEEPNVAKVGKSTEYSPDFAEDNNTTVIETTKQKQLTPNELAKIAGPIENKFQTPEPVSEASSKSSRYRRSSRVVRCSSSDNEECKKKMITDSEKGRGKRKEARREKRNKEREAKPCNCGGNKNTHELLYLMEENGSISRHRCIGAKEETEKQIGKGLYTNDELQQLIRDAKKYESEYARDLRKEKLSQSSDQMETDNAAPKAQAPTSHFGEEKDSIMKGSIQLRKERDEKKLTAKERVKKAEKAEAKLQNNPTNIGLLSDSITDKDLREAGSSKALVTPLRFRKETKTYKKTHKETESENETDKSREDMQKAMNPKKQIVSKNVGDSSYLRNKERYDNILEEIKKQANNSIEEETMMINKALYTIKDNAPISRYLQVLHEDAKKRWTELTKERQAELDACKKTIKNFLKRASRATQIRKNAQKLIK